MDLTIELPLLTQQLRMKQMTNDHQRRVTTQVRNQVWQPHASMDYAQYEDTPYLSNHNFGWGTHPNTSWNTSYTTLQLPHVQRSSLEDIMAELARSSAEMEESRAQMAKESLEKTMIEVRRCQANLVQAENEILMGDMDYSQDGFPWFYVQNEMSEPPQEEMYNLEATMAELRRVQAESTISQAQFMEKVHTPSQNKSKFESEVDELAITMAKLAKCRAKLLKGETRTNVQIQPKPLESLEKKKTPRVNSCTQHEMELQQPPMEKGMSIQEIVAKHMNEKVNMSKISFEGQQERLPTLFEVIKEEGLN